MRFFTLMRLEIPKALLGESALSQEDLSSVITALREKNVVSNNRFAEIQNEVYEKKELSDKVIPAYRQFRTWASEFEDASIEAKKMIVSEIFSRIEIGKGYKIRCVMNFTYKQFCEDWMTLDKRINILELNGNILIIEYKSGRDNSRTAFCIFMINDYSGGIYSVNMLTF